MDLNQFGSYSVHILIPQNNEIGELELRNIGGKCKNKIQLVIHNYLRNAKWNQITNTIKEF